MPSDSSRPAIPETETGPLIAAIRARTPARILIGRAGPAYRTDTQLELRQDHAFAADAVHVELNLERDFDKSLVETWKLFEVTTLAGSKAEYLLRPDRGRRFSKAACALLLERCRLAADLQVVIGDGLSAAAVIAQVPLLLPLLRAETERLGWSFGQPFVVRHCRVGIMNELGDLLRPDVVVLLIGERPGLATAESLSAYLAYRPRSGHTDAQRNLISNIHGRGIPAGAAAPRILALAQKLQRLRLSGVDVKEELAGGSPKSITKRE
jgi:ethanolamine ammonia-lyase small subunit